MYGLTECMRVSYLPPDQVATRPDLVGDPDPGHRGLGRRTTEGSGARSGEVGELMVRGPHVMQGYWRDPERTAERLRPGRWPWERVLATGDLFRRDEEGFLHWVGRTRRPDQVRGEKVLPARGRGGAACRSRACRRPRSSGCPTGCWARPCMLTSPPRRLRARSDGAETALRRTPRGPQGSPACGCTRSFRGPPTARWTGCCWRRADALKARRGLIAAGSRTPRGDREGRLYCPQCRAPTPRSAPKAPRARLTDPISPISFLTIYLMRS